MNVKEYAKEFAINAHQGQIRKSEPEKPMIVHPIYVGNLLEKYNFDENVVAAGYLHDVVEDTKYTKEDLKQIFGEDITSLVMGATEPDKSLSWEERKQHTINTIKTLDFRHKAIIIADKISNLEDIRNTSEIKGEYNFNAFKRGYDKQKWYYTEIYNSLIINEDVNHPLLVRLKELINHVFNGITQHHSLENEIFKDKNEEYKELIKIHYKKYEIYKLNSILSNKTPYVIEFTGTPRTGKTTLINNLYDFFKKANFNIKILEEFTTSKKYKQEIYPTLKDKTKELINKEIPKHILRQLNDILDITPDIIIVDRSLFDRLIWVDRLFNKSGMKKEEYIKYQNTYIPLIKEKINIVISTYTDSLTALKRDYSANLSLEKRNFLNEKNIDEYNISLLNMKELSKKEKINFELFDTTNKNQREISFEVIDFILEDMKKNLLKKVRKEFN